ncbi:S24 family peptidase [Vibrio parahaemolyticus]|nr:S24 family peptidase [Vibrio parahaemolyticus]
MKILQIKASAGLCGFESPASEYSELQLSLDELLVDKPSSVWLGIAAGDSMIGAGIFDGDLLIIDRSAEVQQGDIVVVNFNGEFAVKQIDIYRRLLMSHNQNIKPVYIGDLDVFSSEGVVTSSVRLHRPRNTITSRFDA